MNFLLHRHLAATELGATAGIGAMLPDLWRMADRRLRARPGIGEELVGTDADLAAGVEHHLDVDRQFHHDLLFVEGERQLVDAVRAAGITARRMGMLAHVAWELCLDGALLARVGVEPTLTALGEGLDPVRGEPLATITRYHAPAGTDGHWLEHTLHRLDHLFEQLLVSDWIPGYRHAAGIADRLGGVRRRLGLAPLDADERRRLVACLEPALDLAHHQLGPWLDHRSRANLGNSRSDPTLPPTTP